MDELIAFLRARYDEKAARAQAAIGSLSGEWHIDVDGDVQDQDTGGGGNAYVACGPYGGAVDDEYGAHIVDNDPAAVLRSIAGKRKIVAMAEAQPGWEPANGRDDTARHWDEAAKSMLFEVLHHLAKEFADHPEYDARAWGPLGSGNPVPE